MNPANLQEQANLLLRVKWQDVLTRDVAPPDPGGLRGQLKACLTSTIKSYRYCLVTQVLAKATDHGLDALSLQKGDGSEGTFDPRTLASKVVCKWERENDSFLGGSEDPSVNNPLRMSRLTSSPDSNQRHIQAYSQLVSIIEQINGLDATGVNHAFELLLWELRDLRFSQKIELNVPNRVSPPDWLSLVHDFLSDTSGGARLQVVCECLFDIFCRNGLFDSIVALKTNEASTVASAAGDIVASRNAETVLAIEVKDRLLKASLLQDAIKSARGKSRDLLVIVRRPSEEDRLADNDCAALIRKEFNAGLSISILSFDNFLMVAQALMTEADRRQFLELLEHKMISQGVDPVHRARWRHLVKSL